MIFYYRDLQPYAVGLLILLAFSVIVFLFSVWMLKKRNKGEHLLDGSLLLAAISFSALLVMYGSVPVYNDNDIIQGKALTQCRLVEENALPGAFSEAVNKVNCDGVIKNIPVSDFNRFTYAYEKRGHVAS